MGRHFLFSIAPRQRAGGSQVRIQTGRREFFFLLRRVQIGCAAQAVSRAMCTGRGGFTGVKAAGGGGVMSITSRVEVKNEWSHTSTPPVCLDGLQRDYFTFQIDEKLYCNLFTF